MEDTKIGSNSLYSLFKSFENYSLSYVYKGIFNPLLTDKILSLTENNMAITGEASKTQKKVYFVMVESLQNITRHQDVNQAQENQAFFVVQNKGGIYDLASGNVIEKDHVAELKIKLDKINGMDAEELKDYYKHVLANTGLSEKGGAGLGLIEMARRSGNKLAYDFEPINDKLSYFYFRSKVSLASDEAESSRLNDVKQLHEFMQNNDVNMIYQGVFTHDNLKSLLTMTEGSVTKADNVSFKRKAVNVMIELLQNICNHAATPDGSGEGKPGILVVSGNDKGFGIMSGNYITTNTVEAFRNKVDRVNKSNIDELNDYYSEIIMREQEPGQKGAGLGFIDIRMKTGSQINYSVTEINKEISFISITVFIPF